MRRSLNRSEKELRRWTERGDEGCFVGLRKPRQKHTGSRSRVARIEIALCRAWLNWILISCDSGVVYVWSTSVLQLAYALGLTEALLLRPWAPDSQPLAKLVTKTQQLTIVKWGICSPLRSSTWTADPSRKPGSIIAGDKWRNWRKRKRKHVASRSSTS